MARSTVEVELIAQVAEANKTVKRFADDTQKQLNGINFNSSVAAISSGFLAIKAAGELAFSAISGSIGKAIDEASEAEQANFRLANSLKLVGGFSQQALDEFKALASELQRTTAFSDDAVLSAAGLAKGYQLTNAEVKRLLPVAADLAAFLRTDLDTAAQSLARTFNGELDKALAKNIKGLKGLSEEQLNAGEAIKIIGERVKGTAAEFSGTFAGSLQQFRNSFNDVFEEFGTAIIQTPELTASIRSLGSQFGALAVFIASAAPAISEFVALSVAGFTNLTVGLTAVTKGAANIVAVGAAIVKFIIDPVLEGAKAVYEIVKAIYTLGKTAGDAEKQFNKFISTLNPLRAIEQSAKNLAANDDFFDPIIFGALEVKKAALDAAKAIKETESARPNVKEGDLAGLRAQQKAREKALNDFNSIRASLEQAGLSEVEKINLEAANKIKIIRSAIDNGVVKNTKELQSQILGIELDRNKKVAAAQKKSLEEAAALDKKLKEEATNNLKGIISDPIKASIDGSIKNIKDFQAAGAGFVSNILKGSEGALNLVKQAASAAASKLLGDALGPVAGEIVGVLAQGPEKVKELVQEFARSIPQIIQNLIEALPVLIEALARELPPALAKTMPFIAQRFALALVKNIPQIIKGFAEGLFQAAKDFGQAIIDFVKDAGGLVSGISGKGSGGVFEGVPVLGGIGDLLGLAEGGRVPDSPRFEGDKFPARLNAGEQVLSKDLSAQLERFLSGGGNSGQPIVVNLVVGQQQLARAILDLNRGGFRTV